VARIQAERLSLAKREKSAWEWWFAIDPNERLGTDEIASGPEQWVASSDGAHFDAVNLSDRASENRGIHLVHAGAISTKSTFAYDEGQRHGINAEDQRPFLGHDM
jgi:hypothetical protein